MTCLQFYLTAYLRRALGLHCFVFQQELFLSFSIRIIHRIEKYSSLWLPNCVSLCVWAHSNTRTGVKTSQTTSSREEKTAWS